MNGQRLFVRLDTVRRSASASHERFHRPLKHEGDPIGHSVAAQRDLTVGGTLKDSRGPIRHLSGGLVRVVQLLV